MFIVRMLDVGKRQSEMNVQFYVHVLALSMEGHMMKTTGDGGVEICLESSR